MVTGQYMGHCQEDHRQGENGGHHEASSHYPQFGRSMLSACGRRPNHQSHTADQEGPRMVLEPHRMHRAGIYVC